MRAGQVVFQQLLNGSIQYRVPLFQRTYSWEQRHWDRLWEDILDGYSMKKPRNHFIGAVVTQPITDAPERASKHLLIDGQQRLTTIFVLLAVIRDQALQTPERWPGLAEEIQETCLVNKYAQFEEERLKLRPTQADRETFAAIIHGEEPPKGAIIEKLRAYFQKNSQRKRFGRQGNRPAQAQGLHNQLPGSREHHFGAGRQSQSNL